MLRGTCCPPLPSTNPIAAAAVKTSPPALPLAVSKSFQALPRQPLTSSPHDQTVLCTSRSCLDWNNLKCFLLITEVEQAGGCAPGRPVDLHVSAVAGNFSNDSHACWLSLGFPEIQGLFQTLVSVCDMSDSVCIIL